MSSFSSFKFSSFAPFLVLHALLWGVAAIFVVSALHLDTVEIVAWSQHWALTYPKHPPLATWLFLSISYLSDFWISNALIFSQALVMLTAFLIWKTVRLYASRFTAAISVLLFMESVVATHFSVQFNHNTIMLPFAAALLYFGLKYLEYHKSRDAMYLSLSAAGAFLSKYESLFIFMLLLGFSLLIPRFRSAWRRPATYLAGVIFVLLILPHLYGEWQAGWPSLFYATENRPIHSFADFLTGLHFFFNGTISMIVGPVITLLLLVWFRIVRISLRQDYVWAGNTLIFLPSLLVFVISVFLMQIFRQGWLVPFIPAFVVGIALRFDIQPQMMTTPQSLNRWAMVFSSVQFVGFLLTLWVRIYVGHPMEAYSFDSSALTDRMKAVWQIQNMGHLSCFAAPHTGIGMSPLLHLSNSVEFVNLKTEDVSSLSMSNLPCKGTGGLIVLPYDPPSLLTDTLPLNSILVDIVPVSWMTSKKWSFKIFVVPKQSG